MFVAPPFSNRVKRNSINNGFSQTSPMHKWAARHYICVWSLYSSVTDITDIYRRKYEKKNKIVFFFYVCIR